MSQYLEFVSDHYMLFIALVVILVIIGWTELQRFIAGDREIAPAQAVQLINHEDALMLDIREDNELQEGRIKGAKHITLGALKQRLNELTKYQDSPVITYCRTGSRSGQACDILQKNGFQRVFTLKGGLSAWRDENLPITKKK